MKSPQIAGKKLVFAPVLRAGMTFAEGMVELVPTARIAPSATLITSASGSAKIFSSTTWRYLMIARGMTARTECFRRLRTSCHAGRSRFWIWSRREIAWQPECNSQEWWMGGRFFSPQSRSTCVYQKLKLGRSGDEVRLGWQVT